MVSCAIARVLTPPVVVNAERILLVPYRCCMLGLRPFQCALHSMLRAHMMCYLLSSPSRSLVSLAARSLPLSPLVSIVGLSLNFALGLWRALCGIRAAPRRGRKMTSVGFEPTTLPIPTWLDGQDGHRCRGVRQGRGRSGTAVPRVAKDVLSSSPVHRRPKPHAPHRAQLAPPRLTPHRLRPRLRIRRLLQVQRACLGGLLRGREVCTDSPVLARADVHSRDKLSIELAHPCEPGSRPI